MKREKYKDEALLGKKIYTIGNKYTGNIFVGYKIYAEIIMCIGLNSENEVEISTSYRKIERCTYDKWQWYLLSDLHKKFFFDIKEARTVMNKSWEDKKRQKYLQLLKDRKEATEVLDKKIKMYEKTGKIL